MHWSDDEALKKHLSESATRQQWAEDGALSCFSKLMPQLPEALRSKDRIGPLEFAEIRGTEGRACWMVPLDGSARYGKILGQNHTVKLVDPQGQVFFEGRWGDTTRELIEKHQEFFVWVAPPERKM